MFLALGDDDRLVEAFPRRRATCPLCARPVVSKCGEIVEWHWAHLNDRDCDSWAEPETPWHRWWKSRAPVTWREVAVGEHREHRADIRRLDDGVVIELQHSAISPEEIRERERFYNHMVWLIDGRLLGRYVNYFDDSTLRFSRVRDGLWSWQWPRRSFQTARKKVFIDLGKSVVQVRRFEEVVARSYRRDDLPQGFYVHGVETPRDVFIERARLRAVNNDERDVTVSIVAEWRARPRIRGALPAQGRAIVRKTGHLKRREFRDDDSVRRWATEQQRADLAILRWKGDGSMVELDAWTAEEHLATDPLGHLIVPAGQSHTEFDLP